MKDCVFCNFKDRKALIYEDNLCYAVISKNPINKHHILIIPKEHYQDFTELPDKLASHIFIIAKKLAKALRKSVKPDAITCTFDEDISKKGYNQVSHYKFHIIPRFEKDINLIDWSPLRSDENDEALSKYADDIKKALKINREKIYKASPKSL